MLRSCAAIVEGDIKLLISQFITRQPRDDKAAACPERWDLRPPKPCNKRKKGNEDKDVELGE
jgi:hypothetical protein